MQVLASLENAGNGEFFREHDFTQVIDRFLFLRALLLVEDFQLVEDLAQVARRINSELVAHREAELLGQIDADYGRIALEIELAQLNEFADRNHLLFLRGINPADHRRETPVLKFHDHGPLDVGCGRDHAGSVADFYC